MATAFSSMFSTMNLLSSAPKRPFKMITLSADRQAKWASVEADINSHLLKSLPTSPPLVVTAPMRHLVLTAPKTIAPSLCLAACELVGGRKDDAMAAACALRLMHAAVSTHHRLLGPKDQSSAYSDGVELMTGDGLIPLGFEMLASSECDTGLVLRVIGEMAEAMGAQGVMEGILTGGSGEERLTACGAACGAILGGGSEEAVEVLRRCGKHVGMMRRERKKDEAEEFRVQVRDELRRYGDERAAEALLGLADLCFEEQSSELLC